MSALSDGTLIVRAEEQISADVDGEYIALHTADGLYYGMEDVAGRIWELIGQPTTLEAVRDTLLDEFDVDSNTCHQDLVRFVEALHARGLVKLSD